ncbi:MAG: helix-turn-helix domain-containing protein [Labedaea sp.]
MNGSTDRRYELGRALRTARNDAGLTQAAVAERLGCTQGKINKIEATAVTIDPAELDIMLALYHVPEEEAGRLRALVACDVPRLRPSWLPSMFSAFRELTDREWDAAQIQCWHAERMPRQLQSELYMLRQFEVNRAIDVDATVTKLLKAWRARSRIFTLDQPPDYHAILSESSLHRVPGGRPDLIVDQIEYLLTLLRRHERIRVQILTYEAPIPFVDTDFEILRFPDEQATLAYSECPGGGRTYKGKEAERFATHWNDLHGAALSEDESVLFMERAAQEARVRRDTKLDK